jgi:hypothetical protein
LVIVMTRNQAGKDFDKHHREFIAAIAESVSK